jgi:tryptophan-rich sensory protein
MADPDRSGDGPPAAAQAVALGGALALSYGAAAAGQWATSRSLRDWYPALKKPSWTPSGRVIGAVWTVLYGLMGLSLWLDWRRGATSGAPDGEPSGQAGGEPVAWFGAQLALNVLWSYAFFGARSTGAGLAVIGALWLAVAGWVRAAGETDRLAGRLQYPYLAWVSFAGLLNATIWWLNRGRDA